MFKKKDIPLILGFSIPILMILFIIVSIYIPGFFLHPKYNFLYSTDGNYYNSQVYIVDHGYLIQNTQPTSDSNRSYPNPQLYIHNVITNKSTAISFQAAQVIRLDSSSESLDGYKLENGNQGDGFFPFFWYDKEYNTEYLIGHNTSEKLDLKSNSSNYYNAFHFLGWIMQ